MFSYSVFAWLNYSFHLFLQYFFVWIFTYYPCSMYFAISFCIHNFTLLLIRLNVWKTMEMLQKVKKKHTLWTLHYNQYPCCFILWCMQFIQEMIKCYIQRKLWHLINTFWYMLFNMIKRQFNLSNMNAIDACNVYWVRRFKF